jgi:hypothetical protein
MAYKMKGYTYPGTSPVKAKTKSVVSQAKTKADASLVWAGEQLGKAYKPEVIDYTIDNTEIKVPKKEKKKKEEKKEKKKKGYDARGKHKMDPNQLIDRPIVTKQPKPKGEIKSKKKNNPYGI